MSTLPKEERIQYGQTVKFVTTAENAGQAWNEWRFATRPTARHDSRAGDVKPSCLMHAAVASEERADAVWCPMVIINFAHPLTDTQREGVRQLTGSDVERVISVPPHFDQARPFADQVVAMVDAAKLTGEEWQTLHLVIVPPSLSVIACLVMAEVHGRAGYFVPCVRLRSRPGVVPPVFEVAEVLNAQRQRESARARR